MADTAVQVFHFLNESLISHSALSLPGGEDGRKREDFNAFRALKGRTRGKDEINASGRQEPRRERQNWTARALKPNIEWEALARAVTFIRYIDSVDAVAYEQVRKSEASLLRRPAVDVVRFRKRERQRERPVDRGEQSVESFTTARLRLSRGIKGNDVVARDVVMGECVPFNCH